MIVLLIANLFTGTAMAAPTDVKLSYKIVKAGITLGVVEERFLRTGDTYKISDK